MRRKKLFILAISLLLVFTLLAVAGCGSNQPKEEPKAGEQKAEEPKAEEPKSVYPEKPIEMVVPYSPGGGSDRLGRFMQKVIQENNLLPQPIQVVNKPGGSGSVGSTYITQYPGDAYKILTFITGQMTAPMAGNGEYNWKEDFTPISRMALDQFLFLVHKDSPHKSLKDVVAWAKEHPGEFTVGGTALGAEDNMVVGMLEKAAGVDLNYIPFDSGGEVNTNLLGKQIDGGIFNPNEGIGQIESGDFIPLAVFAEERLPDLPDCPTAIEEGYDVVFQMFRGVVGPKDMPAEAVAVLEEALKKVSENSDWQENYIKRNMLTSAYLPSKEFKAYLEKIEPGLIDTMKSIGVYKGK